MKRLNDDSILEDNITVRTFLLAFIFLGIGISCFVAGHYLETSPHYSAVITNSKDDSSDTITLSRIDDEHWDLSEILNHLSTIFIAACIVDIFTKIAYSRSFNRKVQIILEKNVPLYGSYLEHRVLGVYDRLPDIKPLIASAKDEILIVQTYIPGMEDYIPSLRDAFERNPNLKLKIYLLDPNSEAARLRSKVIQISLPEDEIDEHSVKKHVESNIATLKSFIQLLSVKCPERKINVSLFTYSYDLLPLVSVYKFDDEMYIGFFRYGNEAVHSAQMKLDYNKGIGLQFKEHIEYLSKHASLKDLIAQKAEKGKV